MGDILLGLTAFLSVLAAFIVFKPTFRIYLRAISYPQIKEGKQFLRNHRYYTVDNIFYNENGTRMVNYTSSPEYSFDNFKSYKQISSFKYFAAAYVVQDDEWAQKILEKDIW